MARDLKLKNKFDLNREGICLCFGQKDWRLSTFSASHVSCRVSGLRGVSTYRLTEI
jgi:hypothetical protein